MIIASLTVAALAGAALMVSAFAAGPAPVAVDQGSDWTPDKRNDFYTRYQGSRIIPLRWIDALKQPNGQPFMADSLARYGYLPNDPNKLPVDFTAFGNAGEEVIGMTCVACHTRQIEVNGTSYRIDGGPAIVDFQSFVSDLDTAVSTVLKDATAFADFARAVLGNKATSPAEAALRQALSDWYYPHHKLVEAFPSSPWGLGRIDAVGMIFNRVVGVDIGPPPSHVIEANIEPLKAPVRYPFLWNVAKQDKTQWAGFVDNSNDLSRLGRNIGQVLGVFAVFHPTQNANHDINYVAENSADLGGLLALEELMKRIAPPRWPWTLDTKLAEEGRLIFERKPVEGGCAECHGIRPSSLDPQLWQTPIIQVDTDSQNLTLLRRKAKTGVLEGAGFDDGGPLLPEDTALRVLNNAVIGTILQSPAPTRTARDEVTLRRTFRSSEGGYEARVLEGVWAAAPYLHNGSVPTLTELLKPAAERVSSFKVGSAYDPIAVGLAKEQTQFSTTLTTTDCSDRGSGNSRCGHEYGTTLSETEKKALLEYLKSL
jgi:RoxA-like, cytochrome c-like